jgi:CheY-like chemotaxis protein
MRILVIDDNADLRDLLQLMLETAGYEVVVAADGVAGVAAQRLAPCPVVVTDLFMPNQDGIETIGILRSEFPQVKILALSGGAAAVRGRLQHVGSYLGVAEEAGADRVMSKPFDNDELLRIVAELAAASGQLEAQG